jgi:hypothetical protein
VISPILFVVSWNWGALAVMSDGLTHLPTFGWDFAGHPLFRFAGKRVAAFFEKGDGSNLGLICLRNGDSVLSVLQIVAGLFHVLCVSA